VPASERPHILILGGTAEAAALARALVEAHGAWLDVTTSLAGRTRTPAPLAGRVRHGGFGGADALAAYLHAQKIGAVIDATHPFAAQISANAAATCAAAGVPRLALRRPCWTPQPGDHWINCDDLADAARKLPRPGGRVFLTVGRRGLEAFAGMPQVWFLVRLVDAPAEPLPLDDYELIAQRGPFSLAEEQALMASRRIDLLLCKASGGAATTAKLDAARYLGIPVLMVRRPPAPRGPAVFAIGDAISWVCDRVGT